MKVKISQDMAVVLEAETIVDDYVLKQLEKKKPVTGGCSIHNAGMSFEEGRRLSLSIHWEDRYPSMPDQEFRRILAAQDGGGTQ